MDIQTAWVKPPALIGGLDHLAVQAPCINLYGRMLPGITNVTDRARYYSFYPWVVWALEKRGHRFGDTFIDLFRRADCLFTLIAERHANTVDGDRDDHVAATIGSTNIAEHIAAIREGKPVRLSEFAHREENKSRYFKNKLGGLGQYYLGVLRELKVMDGTLKSGIKVVKEVGGVIAETVDRYVNRDLFFATIEKDVVSVSRLDELKMFCPCQLRSSPDEHKLLCDLFLVSGLFEDQNALSRRRSLQTFLALANDLTSLKVPVDVEQFRGCVYSEALPDGSPWKLPDHLQKTRDHWAVYQRNEILSLAVQGIFYTVLDAYQESGLRFQSVDELCRWFLSSPEVKRLNSFISLDGKVGNIENSTSEWLPELNAWHDENHEVQLANRIEILCNEEKSMENRSDILLACLKALMALKSRPKTYEGYGDFVFPANYFQAYPINLQTLMYHIHHTWDGLEVREWLGWLIVNWGINAHLMVALRKLRGQSQSTFRIRPSDTGLEVISVPEAVFTSPRFRQALRILKDIGALVREGECWTISELGQQFMRLTDE